MRLQAIAALLLFSVLTTQSCVLSAPLQMEAGLPPLVQIEKVDTEIIRQTCEVFKVNTALRTEFGRSPRGRRMRMLVAQTANYYCTCAGLLVNMCYNLYFSKHGGTAPIATQLSATVPRFIGKAFYLLDLVFETALQAREHEREVREGFDPQTTFREVSEMKSKLDDLFTQRGRLLGQYATSLEPDEATALKLDGAVLWRASGLAMDEFCNLYARARSISRRNRVFNGLTTFKKGDATFGADMTRIIGAATVNKYLNGPASISTTLSGFMSTFDPYVEMGAERLESKKRLRESHQILTNNAPDAGNLVVFDQERQRFELAAQSCNQSSGFGEALKEHQQIYSSMEGLIDALRYQREKELHHQKMHDIHSIVYHFMYGGSKVSRGAWLIYVGFAFLHAHGRMEKQRVSLINGYAGIDNFSGSFYRVVDFTVYDILQFLHRRRDSIERRADDALIRSRWDILDTMEENANRGLAAVTVTNVK